jgi:acetolactate synthase-1/2/3 large subunit
MSTVVECVIQEAFTRGNRHIFGIPGGGTGLSLVTAAHRAGIRYVLLANEASAAMAAAAYGRYVGAAGLCFSIQGTGGANMVGGVACCVLDRGPVVAITDRYPDNLLGRVTLQDVHLGQVFAPMVKRTMTLRPESARSTLATAFDLAWAERPGPVHLDFPMDVSEAQVTEPAAVRSAPRTYTVSGDVKVAIKMLDAAQRVVVVVGSDLARTDASAEVMRLVERCRAVALANFRGRGVIPEDHPRYGTVIYGNWAAETCEMDFLSKADLVVVAGGDAIELAKPWPQEIPTLEIQLSPDLAPVCAQVTCKLFGPLKQILGMLAECQARTEGGFSAEEIRQIRQNDRSRYAPTLDDPLPAQAVFDIARRLLPRAGILVQETGIYNVLNEHVWPVYSAETCVSIGGSRTMGSAIPWAIGTALARPGVPILAVCGDGGCLMRIQELEAAARLGLKIIFVIFNDRQLGTIQARAAARRLEAPGLTFAPVDFAAVARSFGLEAATVATATDFEEAMQRGLASDRSMLVDVQLDPHAYVSLFSRMLGAASSKKA